MSSERLPQARTSNEALKRHSARRTAFEAGPCAVSLLPGIRLADKASESCYQSLIETMMDGFAFCQMLYDEQDRPIDWIYLAVNPAFVTLTGLGDIVGKRVTEAIPDVKESSPELFAIYGRVAAGGLPERFETQFDPLAMCLDIAVSSPAPGYFVAVFEDITSRKHMESALRLTQLSMDRAADLVHWVGPDGQLLYANDASCLRHGYTREELLSLTVFDLDPSLTQERWAELWRTLRAQGSLNFETVRKTKSGEVFPVKVVVNHVRQGDREFNFTFARDISRRRQAEEGLQQAKQTLEASNRELGQAVHKLEQSKRELLTANRELERSRETLATQARTDPRTGCLNHGAVFARLEDESARARRTGRPLLVAMMDVDRFKETNDTFGHPAGDQILCEMVARAKAALRPYDIFGRCGGDEFLLVVEGADAKHAHRILERLRRAVASVPVCVGAQDIHVTVSIGGVVGTWESTEALVHRADAALYEAKAQGRNRVAMSTREPSADATSEQTQA